MVEDVIIGKVLESPENWRLLLDCGVKGDFFQEKRPQFQFIQSFYSQYGELPTVDVFKKNFPSFDLQIHEQNIEYWIDELENNRSTRIQNEILEKALIAKNKGSDSREITNLFIQANMQLLDGRTHVRDINLRDTEKEKEYYLNRKESEGITGIPYGMSKLDSQTGGGKPGQLAIIVGPPKNMKTWLATMCAYNAWAKYGKKVLLVSKEMMETEIRDRIAWFDAKFPNHLFVRGQLDKAQENKYFEALALREQRSDFIISADDGDMDQGGGVSLVAAKIDRYRPDFVVVDGAYLLTDDRGGSDWQATRNVFRDLKRLARRKKVHILATTQPQRLKEKDGGSLRRKLITEDVGGAYTISQDCDFMLGVRRAKREIIEVYIICIRNGDIRHWNMMIDLDYGKIEEMKEELDEEYFDSVEELSREELRYE